MNRALFAALISLALGCNPPDENPDLPDAFRQDVGQQVDLGSVPDDVGSTDSGTPDPDLGTPADMGGDDDMDSPPLLTEMEPNDGTTVDEVNDLPVGARLSGVLLAGDSDIFAVATDPGGIYRVSLETTNIDHHITVIDYGRDGDNAGEDYVKISRSDTLEFVAMGEGGHLVVVRDANNVDGGMVGGDDFTYVVEVEELDLAQVSRGAFMLGDELGSSLDRPTDVHIWTFDGMAGMDVLFDMSMPTGDGRLYVVATALGDWIARQDNRAIDDSNPLLDAPLTESGPMWLVVEDITEAGPASGYTIQSGP